MKTKLHKLIEENNWIASSLARKLNQTPEAINIIFKKDPKKVTWRIKEKYLIALEEMKAIKKDEFNPITLFEYEK